MRNICVIGVGYVGLVTGTAFADLGNKVTAIDISEERIANLKKGILPIYEPGLKDLVERNMKAGRLNFTTSYDDGLEDAEFVFICVGTPEGVDGEADLQYVRAAAETIAQKMKHPLIIINKSTVPVGTGDWVADIVRETQHEPIEFSVVSCPEFLREGSAVSDFFNPDRTVLGSTDLKAADRVAQLHLPLRAPIIVTDLRTAEMIKYASNAFLATKISFINEIANICEALGADVKEVAAGMGYDTRIGPRFLEAGVGYGGSCFTPEETIFSVEDGQVVAKTLETLFEGAGEAIHEGSVEVKRPEDQYVLGFDPETGCPDIVKVNAFTRRPYQGDMVTMITSMGRSLTVTADHPVLLYTPAGLEIELAENVEAGQQFMAVTELLENEVAEMRDLARLSVYRTLEIETVEHQPVDEPVYSLETTTGIVILASGLVMKQCFPKDVKALAHMAQVHGKHPQLLQAVMQINDFQRKAVILKLEDILGSLKGKTIGLLGLAFKQDTDDMRESPAITIGDYLNGRGAIVRGYDPVAMENAGKIMPYVEMVQNPYDLVKDLDALIVMTPWNEFKQLDMNRVKPLMKSPIVIDGRNIYDPEKMAELGFTYRGVGRGYNGTHE
jgi:UDP-glucose 6-dehydrogenase